MDHNDVAPESEYPIEQVLRARLDVQQSPKLFLASLM
jgi:hypothetical protein